MSEELETPVETPLDLTSIKEDLARSFVPRWAKESEESERIFRMAEHYGEGERGGRGDRGERRGKGRGRGPGGPRGDRPGPREFGGPRPGARPGRRVGGRDERRGPGGRDDRRARPEPKPEPVLAGWEVRFKADPRGVDGVAKCIRANAQAFRLFDLAWLVLDKAERYRVEFRKISADSPGLFQVREDGSLWLSENEAVGHLLAGKLEKFYRRERVAVDPPKGQFAFVAVCGMSGIMLGPPNYHDYPSKVRRLHAERFSGVPFEVYKSRIRIDRDEASVQKWKEDQSSRDVFYPLETSEGEEARKLESMAEVEQDFRRRHAGAAVMEIRERALAPGTVVLSASSPAVRALVRRALEELRRFPLALAHVLARQLTAKGLHIFKAHENTTYVSIARPRYLDREATPVADGVSLILAYLEKHPSTPRAAQWKAIVALRPIPEGGSEKERDAAVTGDLLWLLHEGHVIDFAGRGLQLARKPKVPPPPKKKVAKARVGAGSPGAETQGPLVAAGPDAGVGGSDGVPEAPVAGEVGAPEAAGGTDVGNALEGSVDCADEPGAGVEGESGSVEEAVPGDGPRG